MKSRRLWFWTQGHRTASQLSHVSRKLQMIESLNCFSTIKLHHELLACWCNFAVFSICAWWSISQKANIRNGLYPLPCNCFPNAKQCRDSAKATHCMGNKEKGNSLWTQTCNTFSNWSQHNRRRAMFLCFRLQHFIGHGVIKVIQSNGTNMSVSVATTATGVPALAYCRALDTINVSALCIVGGLQDPIALTAQVKHQSLH